MALEYDVAAFSVQGKRERMEDAYFLDPAKRLFIVADGVWGSAHGDEASKLAIDITVDTLGKIKMSLDPPHPERTLKKTVAVTQSAVRARFGDGRKGSTTLTLLFVTDLHLSYCHVGDSRLYVVKAPPVSFSSWWRRSASTPGDCGFLVCTDGLYKHQQLKWLESTYEYESVPFGEYFGKAKWKKKVARQFCSMNVPLKRKLIF